MAKKEAMPADGDFIQKSNFLLDDLDKLLIAEDARIMSTDEMRSERLSSSKLISKATYTAAELRQRKIFLDTVNPDEIDRLFEQISNIPILITRMTSLQKKLDGLRITASHALAADVSTVTILLKRKLRKHPELKPFYDNLASITARKPKKEAATEENKTSKAVATPPTTTVDNNTPPVTTV